MSLSRRLIRSADAGHGSFYGVASLGPLGGRTWQSESLHPGSLIFHAVFFSFWLLQLGGVPLLSASGGNSRKDRRAKGRVLTEEETHRFPTREAGEKPD